jgi:hypothetical protein
MFLGYRLGGSGRTLHVLIHLKAKVLKYLSHLLILVHYLYRNKHPHGAATFDVFIMRITVIQPSRPVH